MLVKKKGKIVDIPVKAGTVVRLREGRSGKLTNMRAIVMGTQPADNYSRAYGRQVYVCQFFRGRHGPHVATTGAGDLYPVGKVKRIPKGCKEAMADYERMYPSLARKRKRKVKR